MHTIGFTDKLFTILGMI